MEIGKIDYSPTYGTGLPLATLPQPENRFWATDCIYKQKCLYCHESFTEQSVAEGVILFGQNPQTKDVGIVHRDCYDTHWRDDLTKKNQSER
jgi:hypothetical protein